LDTDLRLSSAVTIAKPISIEVTKTSLGFTTDDIVRSSIVKDFLIAVDKWESTNT